MSGHPKTAEPTFLCRTWAAYKLLSVGKTQEAEDELAAAFGFHITRIERNGKLICKWSAKLNMTPAEELAMIQKIQDIVADRAADAGVKLPPIEVTAPPQEPKA